MKSVARVVKKRVIFANGKAGLLGIFFCVSGRQAGGEGFACARDEDGDALEVCGYWCERFLEFDGDSVNNGKFEEDILGDAFGESFNEMLRGTFEGGFDALDDGGVIDREHEVVADGGGAGVKGEFEGNFEGLSEACFFGEDAVVPVGFDADDADFIHVLARCGCGAGTKRKEGALRRKPLLLGVCVSI
jgi:hypothetical protein